MKNLRRLGAVVALTLVLGLSAFAGETMTPPCAPPGSTETPPCTNALATPDDGLPPSDLSAPPATNAGPDYLVTSVAVEILESLLSIF
jgi:hypothetical protein